MGMMYKQKRSENFFDFYFLFMICILDKNECILWLNASIWMIKIAIESWEFVFFEIIYNCENWIDCHWIIMANNSNDNDSTARKKKYYALKTNKTVTQQTW